jgi:hypothetical protein
MEYDYLTDGEHDLVVKFESHYERFGSLTDRQLEILEEINQRADLRERPL